MTSLPVSPQEAARELLFRRKARTSFATFCEAIAPEEPPALHHRLICQAGDAIIEGKLNRVLVMMPPGSAKSTYGTVRFPAFYLGRLGNKGVITASYGDTLAERFGGKVRNLVRSSEYQRIFPGTQLAADSQAKGEWETDAGGFYFATGVGGGVTGRRADLVVIDDPIKGRKEADSELVRDNLWNWYIDDLRTRLKPDAAIMVIQTRWHMDDLAGRILPESWEGESGWVTARDGERWYVISVPAEARENDILGRKPGEWLWTDWFDESFWEQTKKTALLHDVRTWNSLYQQVPADEAGTFFQRSWFEDRYDVLPKHLNCYQSGDFAVTDGGGDFTELADWGIGDDDFVYVLDWWYGQTTSDVWVEQMLTRAQRRNSLRFIGEMGPIRRAVEPWLERAMRDTGRYVGLEWLPSGGDKAANARSFQALASQRRIRFPRTEWAERVINQLCRFPAGKYDDAVDTCGLFGRFIASTWQAIKPPEPKQPVWDAPLKISDFSPREAASEW
jgi:predicted phage terminase large subunit-like protein